MFKTITKTFTLSSASVPKPELNVYAEQAAQVAEFTRIIKDAVKRRNEFFQTKARLEGVGIVHIFDECNNKGGLTIAFKKCNDHKSGDMVDIAVNTCSKNDTFSKSHGTGGALEKFFSGERISLPLLKNKNASELASVVKNTFTRLYYYL